MMPTRVYPSQDIFLKFLTKVGFRLKSKLRIIAAALAILSLPALAHAADKKSSSQNVPEPILKAMQQTNELFNTEVVKKGNIDALDRIYTTNARVLPSGANLVRGRDQIKEFWRHAIAGLGVKEARLTTTETEKNGDGILEIGTVQLTLTDNKIETSKYVVYWVKENGAWKWDVDIWNDNQ